MDEGFKADEMVFFKKAAYFPVGKIAELLNVDEDYIDNILLDNPGIMNRTITVEEVETNHMGMYIDFPGCLLMGMRCKRSKVGAHCKYWIFRVVGVLTSGNVDRLDTIYNRKDVHRYVKSLLKYIVPSAVDESYEFRFQEPVQ